MDNDLKNEIDLIKLALNNVLLSDEKRSLEFEIIQKELAVIHKKLNELLERVQEDIS